MFKHTLVWGRFSKGPSLNLSASYTLCSSSFIKRYSVRIFPLQLTFVLSSSYLFFSFLWFDCYPLAFTLMRTPRFDDANDTLADLLDEKDRRKRKSSLASYFLWAVTPKAVRVGNWNLYFWKADGKRNPTVFYFFWNSVKLQVLHVPIPKHRKNGFVNHICVW